MSTNTKICLGIPTGGTMKAKTAYSLIKTVTNFPEKILPVFQYGNFTFENKERIVDIARELLCSHIFFVDCDMSFESDTLSRLLAHDKDIVGVNYHYRYEPKELVTRFFDKDGGPTGKAEIPKELFEAYSIGAGCLLVKTDVFRNMERPYFPIERDEKGVISCTEDVGFCEKARKSGFTVWCDPSISVGHIGDYQF